MSELRLQVAAGGRGTSRRQALRATIAGAGATAFLVACGGTSGGGSSSSGASGAQPGGQGKSEQPLTGGVIAQALPADPPSLDPHTVTTYTALWPAAPAMNQLVQFDPLKAGDTPQDIIPDLAGRWEQPDPTTIVFTLRRGVTFHDGADFSSEDAKVQLEWIKKPPPGKSSPRAGALATVESIDAPDAGTVRIRLARPTPSQLIHLATHYFAIGQARDIIANGEMSGRLIGTGPFRLKSYQRANLLELERNPAYHVPSRPYLDGLRFYVIPEAATRLAGFLAGQYQLIYGNVERSDQKRMRDELGDRVITPEVPGYARDVVFTNARRAPFNDIRVRQAIGLALDRDAAIEVVKQGGAHRGGYMSPKGFWALPEADLRKFEGYDKPNVEKGRQLIAAAGVATPLEASATTRIEYQPMAEFVRDQLSKIGIVLKLTLTDAASAQPALQRGDFDIGPWTVGIGIDDPDTTFAEIATSTAARNWSAVKDPQIDLLYEKQSQMMDVNERKKLVNDLERQALSQYQVAVLYFTNLNFGRYKSVRNFVEHESLYTNRRMESVWLKP